MLIENGRGGKRCKVIGVCKESENNKESQNYRHSLLKLGERENGKERQTNGTKEERFSE